MFDKYEVIEPLGSGSFSTVYLVRHISLDQLRAIKIIPHDLYSNASELTEAQLLKSLSHPGIPQIYDIEEDESFFYLVEEYIIGDSLEHLLLHQPIISLGLFLNICEQLFDIFKYLHSFTPSPILYRDLKPEHIILCENQVKLIDFNISLYVSNQGNNFKFFGNLNYSAPECFNQTDLSLSADIYSIGKLLMDLYKHVDLSTSKNVIQIFQKSTNPDPALRFETVEAFESELQKEFQNLGKTHLVKNIAVVGSNPGCGATHVAISLVSALNHLGYCAIYYENTLFSDLQNTTQYLKGSTEADGYIYYKNFIGVPAYGPGIRVNTLRDAIYVHDYGSDFSLEDIESADTIIYVCGGAIWHRNIVTDKFKSIFPLSQNVSVIANLCCSKQAKAISKALGRNVLIFPFDSDAFSNSKDKAFLFKQLLGQKGGEYLSFGKRKKYRLLHR